MTAIDDELISAFLDGELDAREAMAVEVLIGEEEAWRRRLAAFRADSESLRALPAPRLAPQTRDIVYRSVTESFAMGAERRRVPRFRRRWMLLAAFTVPCCLSLLYLQNPTRDSRLYIRGDALVLRAGRSGEKSPLLGSKEWVSSRLWGELDGNTDASISFQLDAGQSATPGSVQAQVSYDFDGDGKADRVEQYEAQTLDGRIGWQRFTPPLASARGDFRDFRGGKLSLRLERRSSHPAPLELSGSPGELVLPYKYLSSDRANRS